MWPLAAYPLFRGFTELYEQTLKKIINILLWHPHMRLDDFLKYNNYAEFTYDV